MAIIRARFTVSPEIQDLSVHPTNVLCRSPRPSFAFTDDGPGTLCSSGPRHDNDKIDYRKIKILPTADEILAVNHPVYMPKKDLCAPNFLPIGPARHLDLLFRQLRYDSTECIRDICYSAAQTAFLGMNHTNVGARSEDQEAIRQETIAGHHYFLYRGVRVEELLAHENKSLLVRISYECPSFMRGRKMYECGRFKEGMLAALIQLDHITNEFSIFFFEVHLAQTTFSMDNFKGCGRRAAVQLAFLRSTEYDDVLQLCRHALGLSQHCELFLVEFPKVLFAGFYNCLERLQEMENTDFAFRRYLAPDMSMDEALLATKHNLAAETTPPPAYANSLTFTYDMTNLVPSTSRVASLSLEDLSHERSLYRLKQETTLDEGQATALRDCLMREFALTQGPPGCGKTFLGVQLAKTLLASRPRQKPILLVCLTNHALDSFLADLRDAGISKLLRIGSGSKVEWTKSINIQNCRRKGRLRKEDSIAMASLVNDKKVTVAELDSLCKALSSQCHIGTVSWHFIEAILSENYPEIYAQLSTNAPSSYAKAFTFEYWSGGGDLENIRNLHLELASRLAEVSISRDNATSEDLQDTLLDISYYAMMQSSKAGESSIWNLSLYERQRLLQRWETEVDREQFAKRLAALYFELRDCSQDIKQIQDARDVTIMAAHDIIGVTTTACAARWELLRSLEVETLVCEEAGEVMEAHSLCSLLPTLQHAIFIGDPLQLRPETNEPTLSIENSVGAEYRLDESLLERLMFPRDPSTSAMPVSHLNVQRRMPPEIANIARLIYPYLQDHASTQERDPVYGLEERMFWWDHRVPEQGSDELKSHINMHEVEMVGSLVEYLLRGGAYSQGQIAVLTPYSGQLAKLHARLSTTCDIWLNDKDREALLDEEMLALGEEGRVTKDEVAVSDMLRVSTVDNFQGEEANVIVLSTVRSGGSAGFLKTMNRINVACSRAMNGFYIIGNSQTLSQVPMWRGVISTFNHRMGASITACCNTHPEHRHAVQEPKDFKDITECPAICGQTLDCGHKCVEKCHPLGLHTRMPCQEKCNTIFPCGHRCAKMCYQTCGKCQLSVDDIMLDCGHSGQVLCSGKTTKCQVIVSSRELDCGHRLDILCGEDPTGEPSCGKPCAQSLLCGHQCIGKCGQCQGKHQVCLKICAKQKRCGHFCKETCHLGNPCPWSCPEACIERCEHGPCPNRCQEECEPCTRLVAPGCDHEKVSSMLCCLPNNIAPCSRACPKVLDCGHMCPSLHGEQCPPPSLCPECAQPAERRASMLYLPRCGHLIPLEQLDAINPTPFYERTEDGAIRFVVSDLALDQIPEPRCICGAPCPTTRRYTLQSKLASFPKTLDRLIAKMGRKMHCAARTIEVTSNSLSKNFDAFVEDIRPNPLAAKQNVAHLIRRNREILKLQKEITIFRDKVVIPIERCLAELHEAFPSIVGSYKLMFHLHFSVLEYRVISVRIADTLRLAGHLLKLQDSSYGVQRQGLKMLEFANKEAVACMSYCQEALNDPIIKTGPYIEMEIRLQQIRFGLLGKATRSKLADYREMQHEPTPVDDIAIRNSLNAAIDICLRLPTTHGDFLDSARTFARELEQGNNISLAVPEINNNSVRKVEKLWGAYEAGNLTTCGKSHLYPARTFHEGCPDCGLAANAMDDLFRQSSKHLFETQFLAAMKTKDQKAQPEKQPQEEQEGSWTGNLSNEAKFLIAMRKIGKK